MTEDNPCGDYIMLIGARWNAYLKGASCNFL